MASTFPGRQPDKVEGQTEFCPDKVHVYVCKDRIKMGEPAISVADAETGAVIARGAAVRLIGIWDVRQYDHPQPCGSTVVLESDHGEWRILNNA